MPATTRPTNSPSCGCALRFLVSGTPLSATNLRFFFLPVVTTPDGVMGLIGVTGGTVLLGTETEEEDEEEEEEEDPEELEAVDLGLLPGGAA